METMKEKKLPPHEMHYSDLTGIVSLKLGDQRDFNKLGAELAGYDESRFEAVALKVFIEHTPVVTLYAIDKDRDQKNENKDKMLVRKFKMEMSLDDLFFKLKHVNFTVTTGEYDIDNMEVVNK